jgi:hypothetical protein
MLAMMTAQIDQLRCHSSHLEGDFSDGIRATGQREDRPMMIGIHGLIQQGYPGHGTDDIDQCLYNVGIPSLAEVWDTFDDLIHCRPLRCSLPKNERSVEDSRTTKSRRLMIRLRLYFT